MSEDARLRFWVFWCWCCAVLIGAVILACILAAIFVGAVIAGLIRLFNAPARLMALAAKSWKARA